jgi:hypothetical protein
LRYHRVAHCDVIGLLHCTEKTAVQNVVGEIIEISTIEEIVDLPSQFNV